MTATGLDRRRFLALGSLGAGAVVGRPAVRAAAPAPSRGAGAGVEPEAGPVRMTGDGLGLTPAEAAARWTELAAEGRIERDSYSNGGEVAALEAHFAAVLGKERAVFMPTGTLANHLAVRALAGGTGRAIVQGESHLFNDSGDCVQTLSGITLMPLAPGRAGFRLDEVQEAIARTAGGRVARPVSVISVETPVRRRYGETFDQAELDRITAFAQKEGIRLHLDGARIFLQSATTGRAVTDYTRPFDTVYVSLYKYFNAVSGAILAGPRALLARCTTCAGCSVRGSPGSGRSRRSPGTTPRGSPAASGTPSPCPRRSSSASTGTRPSGWSAFRPAPISSGCGCRIRTRRATGSGSAGTGSTWARRARRTPAPASSWR